MTKRRLDETDRAIIAALRADGRMPVAALAGKVGLSRSAVQERLQRLERDGVIVGYTVRLSGPPPGGSVRAYVIVTLSGPICDQVAPGIARLPEVKRCDSLAGEVDMLLEVETESLEDLSSLRETIAKIHGVKQLRTLPVLSTHFDRS